MNSPALNQPPAIDPQLLDPQLLELRDIHLPEAISWWPIAPGWWILSASLILLVAVLFIARKIYLKRQLNRDIKAELENIKLQFQQAQNKSQLVKSLSILLRRANISYYPKADTAGLIGDDWLMHLDDTNTKSTSDQKFNSDIGRVLLTAPYLPDDATLDFDAENLIRLCDSWFSSTHKNIATMRPSTEHQPGEVTS